MLVLLGLCQRAEECGSDDASWVKIT